MKLVFRHISVDLVCIGMNLYNYRCSNVSIKLVNRLRIFISPTTDVNRVATVVPLLALDILWLHCRYGI